MWKPIRQATYCLLTVCLMSSSTLAESSDAPQFFKGKTIRLALGTGAGGTYGGYALLLSQYFGKYIPGHPTVVPEYRPGAGGVVEANYLYSVAPRDGTVIALPMSPVVLAQHTSTSAKYDASKFIWIGQLSGLRRMLATWHTSDLKTFQDLITHESVAGSTGKGSETYLNPALMNHVFGTKIKIVTGYKGSKAVTLALERGEVSVMSSTWANFAGNHSDWLRDKKVRFLVQIGFSKVPAYKQVPLLSDLAKNNADRQLIEFMSLMTQSVGYSIITPPGVPDSTVAILRKAFDATVKDPAFAAAAKRCCVDFEPASYKEVESSVMKAVNAPKSLLDRFIKAIKS
jgi:tripartite-type tricarboxylate transporter receptor subunit TctC